MDQAPEQVTRILEAVGAGDAQAAEGLLPLVYDELRRLAARKMAPEKPGQTLQPTALVHEVWLRLPYHWRWDPQATLLAVLALGDPHASGRRDPPAFA